MTYLGSTMSVQLVLVGVSERYVLQQSVDLAATILKVPSFKVTPTQVMAFKNFGYAGPSYFDIGSGLLPFSITPSEATSVQDGSCC
jgi:hypothetical protein